MNYYIITFLKVTASTFNEKKFTALNVHIISTESSLYYDPPPKRKALAYIGMAFFPIRIYSPCKRGKATSLKY